MMPFENRAGFDACSLTPLILHMNVDVVQGVGDPFGRISIYTKVCRFGVASSGVDVGYVDPNETEEVGRSVEELGSE